MRSIDRFELRRSFFKKLRAKVQKGETLPSTHFPPFSASSPAAEVGEEEGGLPSTAECETERNHAPHIRTHMCTYVFVRGSGRNEFYTSRES